MKILCLTGWQQESNALKTLAPDAMHFAYDDYESVDAMFAALPAMDVAIGWSLGGQLLMRAIARQAIKPQKLLLLGAPFQAVADAQFAHGLSKADFDFVRNTYASNPAAMLTQFQPLIAAGDAKQVEIARALNAPPLWKNGLFWLEELGRTSCRDLEGSIFPETIIAHGENDKVIHPENAAAFARAIPHAKVFMLPERGHALHFHPLPFSL